MQAVGHCFHHLPSGGRQMHPSVTSRAKGPSFRASESYSRLSAALYKKHSLFLRQIFILLIVFFFYSQKTQLGAHSYQLNTELNAVRQQNDIPSRLNMGPRRLCLRGELLIHRTDRGVHVYCYSNNVQTQQSLKKNAIFYLSRACNGLSLHVKSNL